jgi:hypothetical protein
VLQEIARASVVELREPLGGERGPSGVVAQPLETPAVSGRKGGVSGTHSGVEALIRLADRGKRHPRRRGLIGVLVEGASANVIGGRLEAQGNLITGDGAPGESTGVEQRR